MIVERIQNLKNKMEVQIKRLDIRIKNIQDIFNKHTEEIKRVNQ